MAGCGCDCEIVVNYRGQRVPANESFVSWINRRHDFYENEECGDVGGMDTYGPDTLETDGGWTQLGPYADYATGGELTIGPFCASSHWIDLAIATLDTETSVTYVAFGKTATIEIIEANPAIGEQATGLYNDLLEEEYNEALSVPVLRPFIKYENESLLRYTPQIRVDAWHELDESDSPWVITVSGSPTGPGAFHYWVESAFIQEYSGTWSGWINKGPFFFPGVQEADGTPTNETYFNAPVIVLGEKVTLYRDGEVVLDGVVRPSAAETLAATAVDGSYLIVSEVDDSTDRPWEHPTEPDRRKRYPRPITMLGSFVVDREGPVIGATAPQDFYVDNPYQAFGGSSFADQGDPQAIMSTKPLGIGMPSDGGPTPRPFVAGLGASVWETAGGQNLLDMPPGVYSVMPMGARTMHDRAGNSPAYSAVFTVQVHAVPPNNRRGARPKLENVGLQTREQFRARYEHEQVRQVVLTWDRKVKEDTVSVSQVSLTKNGQSVPGCTIKQRSDTSWVITLPSAAQEDQQEPVALQGSKTFWVLTYDPGGEVLTDDIVTREYATYENFPSPATSEYKVVYVDKETGFRYSKSPAGYVQIGEGPPRDAQGFPYCPEPCVLATRTAWLMSSFDGFLEREDVSYGGQIIGTVPSITKETGAPSQEEQQVVTISTKGGFGIGKYGVGTLGSHAKSVAPDSFTPAVPAAFERPPGIDTDDDGVEDEPPAGWDDDCSYWGLGTTIWPCKPRRVSSCACPKKSQTSASVIVGAGDRESIRLRIESERTAPPVAGGPTEDNPRFLNYPFLPALCGDILCSRSYNGIRLPQNTWAGAIPSLAPISHDSSFYREQEKKWFQGVTTLTLLGGKASISAFRYALAYGSRKTAYLSELEFVVDLMFCTKWQYDPADPDETAPEDLYRAQSFTDRFCLSRDQEIILSQSGDVRTVWKNVSWFGGEGGYCWWHISLQ